MIPIGVQRSPNGPLARQNSGYCTNAMADEILVGGALVRL